MFALTVIAVIAATIILFHKNIVTKRSKKREADRRKYMASQFELNEDGLRLVDEWG